MNVKSGLICLSIIVILTLCVPNVAVATTGKYSNTFHNNARHTNGYSLPAKGNTIRSAAWSKTSGGIGDSEGFCVRQTTDGGYIIAGDTNSFSNYYQAYLIKTDSTGKELWSRVFGGYGDESASSVQQTSDGGYIVSGSTVSKDSIRLIYLLKTDSTGKELWSKVFG